MLELDMEFPIEMSRNRGIGLSLLKYFYKLSPILLYRGKWIKISRRGDLCKGEIIVTRSEKIYKKCHLIACFMPAIVIMLEGILEVSERTSSMMWIGIFIADIVLLIVSLIRSKHIKAKDIILSVIGFIVCLGFIIHLALKI